MVSNSNFKKRNTTQTKVQILNCEQREGFTDLCLQNKRASCRPRRRIPFTKYEAVFKGEDFHRKARQSMQQGLADKDMDFAPRKMIHGMNLEDRCSWQEQNKDKPHQNFSPIV